MITDFTQGDYISIYGEGPLSVSSLSVSDNGVDVIAHLSNGEQITFVNASLSAVQAGFRPYLGSPPVIGTVANDAIVATESTQSILGAGGDDSIDGRTSNVLGLIDGGSGDDTIYAGAVAGLVINGSAGNDTIYSASETHGGDGNDTIVIGDNAGQVLVTGDRGDDNLTGGAAADDLAGGSGADVVTGNGGNDVLYSGGNPLDPAYGDLGFEHDVLSGGDGTDRLNIGYGDDADGGAGTDWLDANFSAAPTAINLDSSQLAAGVSIGGGTIQNIERIGTITGSAFGDTFLLSGQAYATIFAGGGNDTITVSGNFAYIEGGDGADQISLTGGNGYIDGGAGNDAIIVNGADAYAYVRAGAGDDIVQSVGANNLLNGDDGIDTVDYSNSASGAVVNLGTHVGAGGEILDGFENVTGSAFADTLTGHTDDNVLHGAGGNDTLNGDAGNDTLDGGTGNDTMKGGTGNDIYYVDSASDVVAETTGAGTDTVHTTITYTLGASVENGILDGSVAINLTGNTLANMLTGNSAANVLDGGAGGDTLTGGGGLDTFVYRTGGARDVITDFAVGESINVYGYTAAQSVAQSGGNVIVTLASGNTITVNNATVADIKAALHFQTTGGGGGTGGGTPGTITGTTGADTLNGTSGNDTINGLAGNDTLNGSGGNDTLDGGTGADIMKGGTGNDVYYVDNLGDRVTELSGQGTDEVRSTISCTLGSYVEKATALGSGAINLTGNTLANTLTGNSGANIIKGNGGADTIKGGLGNDTLSGGAGADVYVYSDVASGADKITDFVSGSDKINLHALGITSADVHTAVSGSNLVISVDADHNGSNDFTITLVGVTHIAASDYIF